MKTDSKQNAFAKFDLFLWDQERRQYNERNQIGHIVDYKLRIYILYIGQSDVDNFVELQSR